MQLPRDFLGRLEIGLERGVLDVVFARRAAGVDIDRDQRLGLVDDDVAAGAQLHGRREHRIELALDAHPGEQRLASRYCLTARTFEGISIFMKSRASW